MKVADPSREAVSCYDGNWHSQDDTRHTERKVLLLTNNGLVAC